MSIPRKVREEAAMICAIAASSGPRYRFYSEVAEFIGASDAAWSLAADAFSWALTMEDSDPRVHDAEAEALIRTGWSPA